MEDKDEKSPYGEYSLDDVIEIEAGNYYLQVGIDIFFDDGKMAFSRKRVEALYDKVFKDLSEMKKNGNDEEKSDAHACLLFLTIRPMRVH